LVEVDAEELEVADLVMVQEENVYALTAEIENRIN
jgi:hypothetical protein